MPWAGAQTATRWGINNLTPTVPRTRNPATLTPRPLSSDRLRRRYAAADTKFSIKEVDIGLAADLGTLQRLPKIVGNDSVVRELAYTARVFSASEALSFGMYAHFPPYSNSLLEFEL